MKFIKYILISILIISTKSLYCAEVKPLSPKLIQETQLIKNSSSVIGEAATALFTTIAFAKNDLAQAEIKNAPEYAIEAYKENLKTTLENIQKTSGYIERLRKDEKLNNFINSLGLKFQ